MVLDKATFGADESVLEFMVLEKGELPPEFSGYQVVREGDLDNEAMAEQGFEGNTAQRFRDAGRVTGFMREFGQTASMVAQDGFNFLSATVVHLFDNPNSVSGWMHDVFLKAFECHGVRVVGACAQLLAARRRARGVGRARTAAPAWSCPG